MDEKARLSTNLGFKLAKQIAKRIDAPPPDEEKLEEHHAIVVAPVPAGQINSLATTPAHATTTDMFFEKWDEYYPRIVAGLGLLGSMWFMPRATIVMFKGLLAVVNNDALPLLKEYLARNAA